MALLAGVSPDYYVRLEQGRTTHVSDQVLLAVAQVLSLSDVETEHLTNIARPSASSRPTLRVSAAAADEPLVRLLNAMPDSPALLIDISMNILDANTAAKTVFDISRMVSPANAATQLFLSPDAHDRYMNWASIAADTVAHLRLMTGRWPKDARLTTLIGKLAIHSDAFRQLWAAGEVREKRVGHARIRHPLVGELSFDYHVLAVPARPDRSIFTYLPQPGTSSVEALHMLLSWTATANGQEAGVRT